MNAPRISVIVPTYNRAHTVGEAIESILTQTRPADEVIVVDDGSSDDTPAVLAAFGDRIDTIRQANAGVSAARNAGIARATGEWVAFLDSDDVWYPERLEVLLRDLVAAPRIGVHIANLRMTSADYDTDLFKDRRIAAPMTTCRVEVQPLWLARSGISCQASAIRRSWLTAVGPFDTGMRIFEDMHLFCRLALIGPWGITATEVTELRRVAGDTNALTQQARTSARYTAQMRLKVFEDLLAIPNLRPAERDIAQRGKSGALLELARLAASDGISSAAYRLLVRSAWSHPGPKGLIKAALALGLGARGYDLALGRRGRFLRSQVHRA